MVHRLAAWLCRVKDNYHALLGMSLLPLFPKKWKKSMYASQACVCPVTQSTPLLSLNSLSAVDIVEGQARLSLRMSRPAHRSQWAMNRPDRALLIEQQLLRTDLHRGLFGVVQSGKRSVTQQEMEAPYGILVSPETDDFWHPGVIPCRIVGGSE